METRERVLGAELPDTLTSMNNLASSLKCLGRDIEALRLTKKCFELRNQRLGADNPDTISSREILVEWKTATIAVHS